MKKSPLPTQPLSEKDQKKAAAKQAIERIKALLQKAP